MLNARRVIYWQICILLAAIIAVSLVSRFLPIVDVLEMVQQRVAAWGAWGAICYPLIFAVCNVLLLPGGVVAAGSGFFFGLWWGFFVVLIGNILAAAFSFACSRWVAHHWFRRKLSQNPALRALEPAIKRESWKIILLSQLHPLFPTSLLNYLFGLLPIRFGTYMLWASLGRIPGLFLYVYVGTLGQFAIKILRGQSYPRTIEYAIWGGAFVITGLILVVLGRIAYRAVQPADIPPQSGQREPARQHIIVT